MKKIWIALAVVGSVLALLGVLVGNYVHYSNTAAQAENGITSVYKNNQQLLGNYTNKIAEASQVPEMYRDDLSKIVKAEMEGRYGTTGSKSTFQWIQERSLNYDPSMYTKLQQIIVAGRDEFNTAQTTLIDRKQIYQNNLDYVWSGFWMKLAGYPKIKLDDYNVVLGVDTEQIFKQGKMAPVQLRK